MSRQGPLVADPKRQAIPAICGYDYQIWRSIEAWTKLQEGEELYLEGAEDFDVVTSDTTTTNQVKSSRTPITLNSSEAKEALQNFILLKQKNPGRLLGYNFLSRARAGKEAKPIIQGRTGVELWRCAARGDENSASILKDYLLAQNLRDTEVFFKHSPQELIRELFSVFSWVLEEDNETVVIKTIERRLIAHGITQNIFPTISVNAKHALRSHCIDVVKKRDIKQRLLTIEDFYFVFDQATSIRVPLSYNKLPMVPKAPSFSLTVPVALDGTISRTKLVDELVCTLKSRKIVILAASVSMGKTTIAQFVGAKYVGQCIWLGLAEKDQYATAEALKEVSSYIEDTSNAKLLIIDDFLLERQLPEDTWYSFQDLIRAAQERAVLILITTRGLEKNELDARLRSIDAEVIPVSFLTQEEIKKLFLHLGCPGMFNLDGWSQQTLLMTSGHPKLVHVQALDLKESNWPSLTENNFLTSSPGVDAQKALTRLALDKFLSEPEKELLYTISLVLTRFPREFILNLGQYILFLSDAGSVFDRLLGRWIDRIGGERYKITPLLSGEGGRVWPSSKCESAHGNIFDSFLGLSSIDADSVDVILMHAMLSRDVNRVKRILLFLIKAKEDQFVFLSVTLRSIVFWIKGVMIEKFDAETNMIFRLIQYRVALCQAPSELNRLAEEWLEESNLVIKSEAGDILRYLMAFSIASTLEEPLAPNLILRSLLNLCKLTPLMNLEKMRSLSTFEDPLRNEKNDISEVIPTLFSFFSPKCTSKEYFSTLLDSIEALSEQERDELFENHNHLLFEEAFYNITQTTWLAEEKKGTDPNLILPVFERAVQLALSWGIPSLAIMGTRIIAITYDEYLDSTDLAIQMLQAACSEYANNDILLVQLANVYFRRGELQSAIDIWTLVLLKKEHPSSLIEPFIYRHAGIAAAQSEQFSLSVDFFEAGARHEGLQKLQHLQCGFYMDAAYVAYCDKDFERMVNNMSSAAGLIYAHKESDEFKWKVQRKMVGHSAMWMHSQQAENNSNNFAQPLVGMCSNSHPSINIQDLPPTPVFLIMFYVMQLEYGGFKS